MSLWENKVSPLANEEIVKQYDRAEWDTKPDIRRACMGEDFLNSSIMIESNLEIYGHLLTDQELSTLGECIAEINSIATKYGATIPQRPNVDLKNYQWALESEVRAIQDTIDRFNDPSLSGSKLMRMLTKDLEFYQNLLSQISDPPEPGLESNTD